VEELPSGRFRAYFRTAAIKHVAEQTFPSKKAALDWLANARVSRVRGTWLEPVKTPLSEYLAGWLAVKQSTVKPTTFKGYRRMVDTWIVPRLTSPRSRTADVELGTVKLSDLNPALVKRWYAVLSDAAARSATERLSHPNKRLHPARRWAMDQGLPVKATGVIPADMLKLWKRAGSPVTGKVQPNAGRRTTTHAYQVLRTALNEAVEDGLIPANPCRIKGGAVCKHPEREIANPGEIKALASAMPANLRAAVIVAAWSSLRFGELFALARRHVNLATGEIRVERAMTDSKVPSAGFGSTKTGSSVRTVALPKFVTNELARHMKVHTGAHRDSLIFATSGNLPYSNTQVAYWFSQARHLIGRDNLTWHDLRHTGATLAYEAGGTVRDVQNRLGHSTARAAMIYAHATQGSDKKLAKRLDRLYASLSNVSTLARAV
jgi:integrase